MYIYEPWLIESYDNYSKANSLIVKLLDFDYSINYLIICVWYSVGSLIPFILIILRMQ